MTMSELLSRIKMAKKKLQVIQSDEFSGYQNQKFITVWNPNKGMINGVETSKIDEEFQSNYDSYNSQLFNLIKMMQVKEKVNCDHYLEIPNPDYRKGGKIKATVTEILVLKTMSVQAYYNSLLNRYTREYNMALSSIEKYESKYLSEDTIRDYVIARLNSLQKDTSTDSINKYYSEYSAEYREANKIELFDPIDLKSKIDALQNWIDTFYNEIDYKLSEFNARTKIWIDLDLDEDFWGYPEEEV